MLYLQMISLFDFFDTKVERGNPAKALKEPYSVMITDELAKKYFGNEDPVNKLIKINPGNKYSDFKITGIYKPFPNNTHIHPDLMMSFSTLNDTAIYGEKNLQTSFGNNSFFTYIACQRITNLKDWFPSFLHF